MNAKRRPRQLRLAEGTEETPHYHGHRERLRQRLIDAGADNLPDYELLEVILFASNARADVKPLAKGLLERFGGFAEFLGAELQASALILVHNHPSGDPTPSKADIAVTKDIVKAAAALNVTVHDHLIIGHGRHSSLRDLGLI